MGMKEDTAAASAKRKADAQAAQGKTRAKMAADAAAREKNRKPSLFERVFNTGKAREETRARVAAKTKQADDAAARGRNIRNAAIDQRMSDAKAALAKRQGAAAPAPKTAAAAAPARAAPTPAKPAAAASRPAPAPRRVTAPASAMAKNDALAAVKRLGGAGGLSEDNAVMKRLKQRAMETSVAQAKAKGGSRVGMNKGGYVKGKC